MFVDCLQKATFFFFSTECQTWERMEERRDWTRREVCSPLKATWSVPIISASSAAIESVTASQSFRIITSTILYSSTSLAASSKDFGNLE